MRKILLTLPAISLSLIPTFVVSCGNKNNPGIDYQKEDNNYHLDLWVTERSFNKDKRNFDHKWLGQVYTYRKDFDGDYKKVLYGSSFNALNDKDILQHLRSLGFNNVQDLSINYKSDMYEIEIQKDSKTNETTNNLYKITEDLKGKKERRYIGSNNVKDDFENLLKTYDVDSLINKKDNTTEHKPAFIKLIFKQV